MAKRGRLWKGDSMKPYYDDGKGIVIYHGDCREILPQLPKADLVLTDPPYGHSFKHSGSSYDSGKWNKRRSELVIGDDAPFEPSHLIGFKDVVLWGANHYANRLPPSPGWLIWDKRRGTSTNCQSDCELAWNKNGGSARLFSHMWNGLCRDSEIGIHLHPTQKPVALMKWCLSFFPACIIILDPYCGSGPVLSACKDFGLQAIGIEIEERYCEIAARRLSQEVFTFA